MWAYGNDSYKKQPFGLISILLKIRTTAYVAANSYRKMGKSMGEKVGQRLNLDVFCENLNALGQDKKEIWQHTAIFPNLFR